MSNRPPWPAFLNFKLCFISIILPSSILTNLILPIFSVINNSLSFIKVEPQGLANDAIFFKLKFSDKLIVEKEKIKIITNKIFFHKLILLFI